MLAESIFADYPAVETFFIAFVGLILFLAGVFVLLTLVAGVKEMFKALIKGFRCPYCHKR